MRVFAITDSLGLPREHSKGEVSYEETWPVRLQQKFTVAHLGIGGATINQLYEKAVYYKHFKPEAVVVQSGIVDCAPRSLSGRERALVEHLPFAGRLVYPILKRYGSRIRTARNVTLTNELIFQEYLLKIKSLFADTPVYFISVLPSCDAYEQQVPGVSKNIERYNALIRQLSERRFIDCDQIPREGILDDHHHLSASGNTYVFNQLMELL